PRATKPLSSAPGSTGRPSSVKTFTRSPSTNLAVSAGAPAIDVDAPIPTASDEPKESNKMACGICASRPALVSWLHITPDELINISDDRSHLPGLASNSDSIGLAK